MSARRTGVLVFPASSYEAAREIAGRLLDAGFPRAAMVVEQAGEDYEVALHTNEANQGRAERAVYGSGYLGKLAVAGAILAVGGALWSFWKNNYSETYPAQRSWQRRYGYGERFRMMDADVASTRLADTHPPGSLGPIEARDQEAAEAGAMPIS
jgi:hypothetical protein